MSVSHLVLPLVVAAAAAALAGACQREEPARPAGSGDAPEVEASVDAGEPAHDPQRIVSQTVLGDEVLWALGDTVRARVVGVSLLADDPGFSSVVGRWPASIPRVGGEAESMLVQAPDLAIVASFNAAETKAMLARAEVETLPLERFASFDDYRANVRLIAARVGAVAEGESIVADFDRQLAKLDAARPAGPPPTVLSWEEGSIAGSGTTFDDACVHAGLTNLAAARDFVGHGKIELETLVAWDPQILVIPCREGDCEAVAADFAARPVISRTRAATEGRVIALPSALLYATGHALLELTRELQRAASTRS